MAADKVDKRAFANVNNIQDFYFQVSMLAGKQMKEVNNTLIFIDEIQEYPQLLTLLKFLREDNRYTYIASGSLLGLAFATTSSIPMGSIQIVKMYPLDLEEFCYANGFNATSIKELENHYKTKQSLDENTHNKLLMLLIVIWLVLTSIRLGISKVKFTVIMELMPVNMIKNTI